MSVQDFIKKSILQSDNYATQSPFRIVIVLLLALLIGAFIYKVYQHFFTGVIYSRSFAMTLVGMTLLTSMVTLAISSNIVISLGMVGALSIVRYRTAVKDPMDLLYLFWAITSGITVGAGMYVLAVVTSLVILLMLIVFSRLQETGKVYIGCRMGWGRQVNAGGIFFRCQLGESCPQKSYEQPGGYKRYSRCTV